jgi:hypothetical protein
MNDIDRNDLVHASIRTLNASTAMSRRGLLRAGALKS